MRLAPSSGPLCQAKPCFLTYIITVFSILAGNIPRQGRLAAPGATAKAHSKLCGSTVIVDLVMADGQVVDFAHDVKACALGQAAASIMARHVIGSTGPELRALRDQVRAMLKENGPPPQGQMGRYRRA